MRRIILLGYMGAGKTTIGKVLAQKLSLEFFDLDWYIEDRFRMKIPQIFAEKGEEGFREIERKMLHEVAEFENVVISCGGGTPCFFDRQHGIHEQTGKNHISQSGPRSTYAPSADGQVAASADTGQISRGTEGVHKRLARKKRAFLFASKIYNDD